MLYRVVCNGKKLKFLGNLKKKLKFLGFLSFDLGNFLRTPLKHLARCSCISNCFQMLSCAKTPQHRLVATATANYLQSGVPSWMSAVSNVICLDLGTSMYIICCKKIILIRRLIQWIIQWSAMNELGCTWSYGTLTFSSSPVSIYASCICWWLLSISATLFLFPWLVQALTSIFFICSHVISEY